MSFTHGFSKLARLSEEQTAGLLAAVINPSASAVYTADRSKTPTKTFLQSRILTWGGTAAGGAAGGGLGILANKAIKPEGSLLPERALQGLKNLKKRTGYTINPDVFKKARVLPVLGFALGSTLGEYHMARLAHRHATGS
jgi:hypothetical protein